jgi:hypothetical protein
MSKKNEVGKPRSHVKNFYKPVYGRVGSENVEGASFSKKCSI